jgi:hypothetical protein
MHVRALLSLRLSPRQGDRRRHWRNAGSTIHAVISGRINCAQSSRRSRSAARHEAADLVVWWPTQDDYIIVSGDWRYGLVWQHELTWAKAIHRVAAQGISPEQAVNDAIARIKAILSE